MEAITVSADGRKSSRAIAMVQGVYFATTGIWPLLHYRSFEKVTGPKQDDWLVKTVGLMIASIGASLILASSHNTQNDESRFLGLSSALGLIGVDLCYSATGRISKIYALDAIVESVLVAAWLNEP